MSGEGRESGSPYVPDYADDDEDGPLPAPAALRFREFRVAFGRAVAGQGSFGTALGHYARRATGGASTGPRRFRPAYRTGGALFALLGELRAGGTGRASAGSGLPALTGRPVGEACEAIALALAPEDGDADAIRIALQEALRAAFAGVAGFDPAHLTPARVAAVQVRFLAGVLFLDIVLDAGRAWNRAPDGESAIAAEDRLRALVRASVDDRLAPLLHGRTGLAGPAEVEASGRKAVEQVWSDWEKLR